MTLVTLIFVLASLIFAFEGRATVVQHLQQDRSAIEEDVLPFNHTQKRHIVHEHGAFYLSCFLSKSTSERFIGEALRRFPCCWFAFFHHLSETFPHFCRKRRRWEQSQQRSVPLSAFRPKDKINSRKYGMSVASLCLSQHYPINLRWYQTV